MNVTFKKETNLKIQDISTQSKKVDNSILIDKFNHYLRNTTTQMPHFLTHNNKSPNIRLYSFEDLNEILK